MAEILGEHAKDFEEVFEKFPTQLGKIYEAFNVKENRTCYLKVFEKEKLEKGDYDFLLQKIKKEEEITKLCKCENVVEIYQKYQTSKNIIFELEYCENNIYDAIINKYGGMKEDKTSFRKIVLDISKALKKLHDNGVMHRDIKPNNIFINEKEGKKIAKLGDFGCSIFIKDNTSDPIGTILYSSPEILQKIEYDEKCDLWSLGITLHNYTSVFHHTVLIIT